MILSRSLAQRLAALTNSLRANAILEYQWLATVAAVAIGGIISVEPVLTPYFENPNRTLIAANDVKFNTPQFDEEVDAIVVVSPGKAIKDNPQNGNNGHGNDADGNDDSNPGHSNDPFDFTDDDGTPGKSNEHLIIEENEIHFTCFDEGFVASGHLKLGNFNNFGAGFCLHGSKGVDLGNQNAFTQGSVVSSNTLHKVTSGSQTTGLDDALTIAHLGIDVNATISDVSRDLLLKTRNARPAYLDATADVVELNSATLRQRDIVPGMVHSYICRNREVMTFHQSLVHLENVAIVTDCPIMLPDGFTTENAIIVSMSSNKFAITGESARIGLEDNCTHGGGAQLLSQGGIQFTGITEFHGSHVLAVNNLTLTQASTGVGSLLLTGKTLTAEQTTMYACGAADNPATSFSLWAFLTSLFV